MKTQHQFHDELQQNVYFEKYALTDEDGEYLEHSPNESLLRCAKEFARIEKRKYKNTKINPLTVEEIMDLFRDFKYVIPQGRPLAGIGVETQIVSLANCFVIPSPKDSYGSIIKTMEMGIHVNKRGGGFGVDFSNIRPKGFKVSNAAKTTSGVVSFLERYSQSVEEVCQAGRRGAMLISLDVTHYDIEDFITIKQKQNKVNSANLSVKITDEFLRAVENDENYKQRFELHLNDGEIEVHEREVSARKVFDLLVESAWKSAEPGVIYIDNYKKRTPSDSYESLGFGTVTTNPCISGDTKILFKGNDKYNLERIDKLYEKDKLIEVYSVNNKSQQVQIKPAKVVYSGEKEVVKVYTDGGCCFKCTPEHKIAILENYEIKYKEAQHLLEDDKLLSLTYTDNKNEIYTTNINCVKVDTTIEKVYDLQVYDNHNFFILAENEEIVDEKLILVKNCGEIGMSDNCSICILMLLNLYSFVRNKFQPDAYFDFVKFEKYTKIAQRLIDDLIDLEIEKINKILHKIKSDKFQDFIDTELELWNKTKETLIAGRRTGLGTNALADMFAALGVKYGSEESKKITDKVFKTFRNAAYESSIEMAEHLGAFPLFDYELEKDNEYLLDLYKDRPDLLERTKKFGRRNISLLTQSPSGSISIIAGTTSGCEPLFQKSYKRKKKSATDANKWEEYDVVHPKLKEFTERTGKPIEESPYNEYHEVNWKDSVDIQSIIQKYIDHSISKTINLPRDTPKETIEQVFITAWKQGCKGITVYVEGSREGILVDDKFEKWQNGVVKRPKSIPAECFSMQFKGEQFVLIVGLVKHNPYEIWIWKVDENNPIFPLKASGLNIYKEKRGKYILKWDKMHDADLGQMNISEKEIYNVELFAFTRMCSAFLRHNPNEIEVLISTVEKINDLNNIPKIICRLLKKYVKDGTKINGTECPNCKGHLIREAGCHCCKGCGYSTCM